LQAKQRRWPRFRTDVTKQFRALALFSGNQRYVPYTWGSLIAELIASSLLTYHVPAGSMVLFAVNTGSPHVSVRDVGASM
jgi:hypothetical protein